MVTQDSVRWRDIFGFEDKQLNARYESEWLAHSLKQLRIALLLAGFFSTSFILLDRIYFEPELVAELAWFRFGVMLPVSLVLYAMTFSNSLRRWVYPGCGVAIAFFTLYFCSLAPTRDDNFLSYLFSVVVQFSLFLFVLLRIPFRITLITGLTCVVTVATAMAITDASWHHRVSVITGMLAIFSFLIFNLFQRDFRERTLFINQLLLAESEKQKDELLDEREEWFRSFAGFLRHELNNQMVGIKSSLEMIERAPDRQDKYLSRAALSLDSMRDMVNEAADATSIDEALESGDAEPFDLTELINECADSYRQSFPDQRFDATLQKGVHITAQPFRIVQLLDKLVDNALRHTKPGTPITIRLMRAPDSVQIEVENEGDPLPSDKRPLFSLWHSKTAGGSDHPRGLGLYVVARIAHAHGGSVQAHDLDGRQGALFVVSLPE